MAQKCRALTSKGKPFNVFARKDDPQGFCMFHSRLPAPGTTRMPKPLDKADLVKMIDATIRQVRRAKCSPLERSRELRALIIERDKLLAEPESKEPGTLDDKVKRWKSQTS